MKSLHLALPVLILSLCGIGRGEPQPSVILNADAADWEIATYCGRRGMWGFVPGHKLRTALSGMLVMDSRGNAYVAAQTFIAVVTPDGAADVLTGHPDLAGSTDGPPGRATFGNAIDIALVNDGLLYVADAANFTLRELRLEEGVWQTRTVAGMPGVEGHRDGPRGESLISSVFDSVAADRDGVVYIFSGDWLRAYKDGVLTTLNPEGGRGYANGPLRAARFYHGQGRHRGLACDEHGNLFVADKRNACLRLVDLRGGRVTTLAGRLPDQPNAMPRDGTAREARFHPGGGPCGLVYDGVNGRLVVHVDDERTIRVLTRQDGAWIVRSLGARRESPDGSRVRSVSGVPAGVDATGNVYLARGGYIEVLRRREEVEK
jgi:hypothetical protein